MRTSSSDLRWPTGSSGKREIPYQIESSNNVILWSDGSLVQAPRGFQLETAVGIWVS
ncbi:hypothetical protein OS493_026620 [Desmophyllum pertusum]|uniref:Uncharacterized protein n=1 Tax=Desmophyllum pertusum TaxID=174260 RepID=A0A9X0CD71_9CNID|nr:hypothetical protein OS493_026620 [Desmophyllum pertusum]